MSFMTPLNVEDLGDGVNFKILTPFQYEVGHLGSGNIITVEAGFVTDYASIPPGLRMLISRNGRHGKPAVIHDKMFKSVLFPFSRCNEIFLEAMTVTGTNRTVKMILYYGVEWFSYPVYAKYKKESEKCEPK